MEQTEKVKITQKEFDEIYVIDKEITEEIKETTPSSDTSSEDTTPEFLTPEEEAFDKIMHDDLPQEEEK